MILVLDIGFVTGNFFNFTVNTTEIEVVFFFVGTLFSLTAILFVIDEGNTLIISNGIWS
jgi:hypothetical protein